jgi:bacterioferritin (cytochrome b1)
MKQLAKRNAAFILDVLSGRLVFERTGVRLYDTVIRKIELQSAPRYHAVLGQLHEIRDEEREHADWLEAQIRALGGNPDEKTDLAQLEAEESRGIESVIVDGHDKVIHLLHALLAAELADNAGWDLLVKLADDTGDRAAKRAFTKRLAEEAKHLLFIREAVVRAAEVEILGRDEAMPRGMRSVVAGSLKKPLAVGGVIGALLLGLGAVAASALFIARPRLGASSRLVMRRLRPRARALLHVA